MGTGVQVELQKKIADGASAFLKTEYSYLAPFVVVMAAFIVAVLEGQKNPPAGQTEKGGWQAMVCFIVGAILSASAGWFGMKIAAVSNVKTMEAA